MKLLLRFSVFTLILLASAFVIWRWPAPSWQGQELRVSLEVDDNFEILFVGDIGTGGAPQKQVAAAMERYCQTHKPRAIVLLGDNFYPRGVISVSDPLWDSVFHQVYSAPCIASVPFYSLLGNHDYRENPAAQIEYRSQSPSWNMPHRFYEIQFGKRLQIVVLDTNVLDVCGLASFCTLDFLWQAVAQRGTRTSVVVGHHPLATSSVKYDAPTFQGEALEKLLCGTAPIYIAGHAHHLEHRRPAHCDLDEFISGGGGATLYPIKSHVPESKFAASSHGFLRLRVEPNALDFTFLNADLAPLYNYRRAEEGH